MSITSVSPTSNAGTIEARARRTAARRGLRVTKLRISPLVGTDCVFLVCDGETGGLLSSQWGMTLDNLVGWLSEP